MAPKNDRTNRSRDHEEPPDPDPTYPDVQITNERTTKVPMKAHDGHLIPGQYPDEDEEPSLLVEITMQSD